MPRRGLRRTPYPLDHLQPEREARELFITSCCGKSENRSELHGGLQLFANLIEVRMRDYQSTTTELLEALSKSPAETSYLERQYRLLIQVSRLVRSATAKTSIADITEKFFDHFDTDQAARDANRDVLRHVVFAAMGWLTMLYTAKMESPTGDFAIVTQTPSIHGTGSQRVALACQRPLGALLRNHQVMPIACPPGSRSTKGQETLLSVTHLNFFSMNRLGDVTIAWVDDLSQHCDFDRYSRRKELKLFRVPSLCAQICLHDSHETLIGRLFGSHICNHDCQTRTDSLAKSYLAEVLLSYRLLFGQDKSSRKLFHDSERGRAQHQGLIDPLLDVLCGKRDLDGLGDTRDLIRERGVYNAGTNFPHLGEKLMELEDYSVSQRPRNLREVWNDNRDPERLLTFKALIIIGGISIVLSAIQIIVGFVQVGLAA